MSPVDLFLFSVWAGLCARCLISCVTSDLWVCVGPGTCKTPCYLEVLWYPVRCYLPLGEFKCTSAGYLVEGTRNLGSLQVQVQQIEVIESWVAVPARVCFWFSHLLDVVLYRTQLKVREVHQAPYRALGSNPCLLVPWGNPKYYSISQLPTLELSNVLRGKSPKPWALFTRLLPFPGYWPSNSSLTYLHSSCECWARRWGRECWEPTGTIVS